MTGELIPQVCGRPETQWCAVDPPAEVAPTAHGPQPSLWTAEIDSPPVYVIEDDPEF